MKTLLALFVLFGSVAASAGDIAQVINLGFSTDGKSYAFAEVGVGDGNGAAYAQVSVLNVKANTLAYRSAVVSEIDNNDDSYTGNTSVQLKSLLAQSKTAAALKKAGITPYENPGRDLLVRLPTDLSTGPAKFSIYGWSYRAYTLTATSTKANSNVDCFGDEPALLTLTITSPGDADNKAVKQILQKDSKLPASRQCAFNYGVARVTVYQPSQTFSGPVSLVSIVSYNSTGFEGPDTRHIGVSAVVELTL